MLRGCVVTIFLTGATGFVGRRLVPALRKRFPQTQVRALVRSSPAPGLLPDGVNAAHGALSDQASLASVVRGAHTVIHLAGVVKPHARDHSDMMTVNAEGTENLYKAATDAGVATFVHLSSAAVYGPPRSGAPFTERDETRPVSPYGRSKLEAERLLLEAHRGASALSIIRAPGIYGAGSVAELPMYRQAIARAATIELAGGVVVHPTHVDDVVGAIVAILESPPAAVAVFNVGGARPILVQGLHALVHEVGVGRKPRRIVLPSAVTAPAGVLAATLLRLAGRSASALGPASRGERLNAAVDDSVFRSRFPDVAVVALEDGLREHIEWARAEGLLPRGGAR